MFYELLLFVVASVAGATVGMLMYYYIRCTLTYLNFKKLSKGLPMMGDRRAFGNQAKTFFLRENLCTNQVKLHERLGKTFGWIYNTKMCASTIDLDLIKLFIYDEPNKHMDRIKLGMPLHEAENGIMLAEGESWRRMRRAFAPALKSNKFKTPNVLLEIEGSIEKLTKLIDDKLDKQQQEDALGKGRLVELDDLIHRYSLNLVFSCFYKQYNQINFDENECHWTKLIDNGLAALQVNPFIHISIRFPVLRPLIDWFSYRFHPEGAARQAIGQFVKAQTKLGFEARKQAQEFNNRKKVDMDNFVLKDGTKFSRNMIDYVIDQFMDGKLTKDEYFDSSTFLFAAADKTAADCLVHTLYQLAIRPELQDYLRQSIRSDGADSEYLTWVLNESLRLMPPAPVGCSRTVTRDIEIEGGHVIPKNTFVVTPAYAIHRLKQYWGEDAEEFKPERWRDTSNHHPLQYMPFGAGPRGCPGKEFALFEMKMVLAALLTRYEFSGKTKDDLHIFNSPFTIFLLPNSPTYLTIKRLEIDDGL